MMRRSAPFTAVLGRAMALTVATLSCTHSASDRFWRPGHGYPCDIIVTDRSFPVPGTPAVTERFNARPPGDNGGAR
jgi:hypothetical protein